MLSPDEIEALGGMAQQLTQPVTDFLIGDIAQRIAEAGQLTGTAAYEVWQAQQMGLSQKELKKKLQRLLKLSEKELEELFTKAAKASYNGDMSRFPTVDAIPFGENGGLQQILKAAIGLAQEDFTNITQTMGFVTPNGTAVGLTEAYRQSCDYAFQKVVTGAQDYASAIREATRGLVEKGILRLDYESGVHTSMEAAVRRSVMGGLGLLDEKITRYNHDELGCDGWEISAHMGSAPDHEPFQGKQYSDARYESLNNSLRRRIGFLKCGHAAMPIILGVNEPQYTDAELEEMRRKNEEGVTYEGRHMTLYEATQRQRALERQIRKQKRRILVDEKTGDEEKLQTDQIRYRLLEGEYKKFSKAAGLRLQHERMEMPGFRAKQAIAAEKTEGGHRNSRLASVKKKAGYAGHTTSAGSPADLKWDSTIGSRSWNKAKRKALYGAEYDSMDKRVEIAHLYDVEGKLLFKKTGDSGSVSFDNSEIKRMHNGILTHNHPNGSCFSPEDINILRRGKLLEVRAVTSQGVYRLQKPVKWSKEISGLEKIEAVYYDIDKQVAPAIFARVAHGDITFAQADAMCQEAVLRKFANRYGLVFDFDTWDDIRREVE